MKEKRHCAHTDMKAEEKEGKDPNDIINHCPIDCSYDNWSPWTSPCPDCYGGGKGLPLTYVENRNQYRSRQILQYTQYEGKACDQPEREDRKCGSVLKGVPLCKKRDNSVAYWSKWGEWENCRGECGHPGYRHRMRFCKPGTITKTCEGEPEEKDKCVTFCPSSKIIHQKN